jgi:hypothetical protein
LAFDFAGKQKKHVVFLFAFIFSGLYLVFPSGGLESIVVFEFSENRAPEHQILLSSFGFMLAFSSLGLALVALEKFEEISGFNAISFVASFFTGVIITPGDAESSIFSSHSFPALSGMGLLF